MVDYTEIPLELQLREAHHCIQSHAGKGCKYPQFLLSIFLRRFPAIMDNQIWVDWDTVMGTYDWAPLFPITLIDTKILNHWCAHPTVWEVARNMQHSRQVLAMVHRTMPEGPKGKPAIIFRASLVYISACQACTSLSDALAYLKHAKGDCVILVSTHNQPTYSPQPRRRQYFTLVPINGDPNMDCGPLDSFAAATLHMASHEGRGGNMGIQIKLPPCFGSSKRSKLELIEGIVLSRDPLWQNVHYVECRASSEVIVAKNVQPKCQELEISLCVPGGKVSYTPTGVVHGLFEFICRSGVNSEKVFRIR